MTRTMAPRHLLDVVAAWIPHRSIQWTRPHRHREMTKNYVLLTHRLIFAHRSPPTQRPKLKKRRRAPPPPSRRRSRPRPRSPRSRPLPRRCDLCGNIHIHSGLTLTHWLFPHRRPPRRSLLRTLRSRRPRRVAASGESPSDSPSTRLSLTARFPRHRPDIASMARRRAFLTAPLSKTPRTSTSRPRDPREPDPFPTRRPPSRPRRPRPRKKPKPLKLRKRRRSPPVHK